MNPGDPLGGGMRDPGPGQSMGGLQSLGMPNQHSEYSLRQFVGRLNPQFRNYEQAQHYSPTNIDQGMWNSIYGAPEQQAPQPQAPLAQIAQQTIPNGEPWLNPGWNDPYASSGQMPPLSGEGWYQSPDSPVAAWTGANNNIAQNYLPEGPYGGWDTGGN